MPQGNQSELRQLLDDVGPRLFGFRCQIEPLLGNQCMEKAPPDAPARGMIVRPDGRPVAVLFLSNETDPAIVARSARKAVESRCLLGSDLGDVILTPLEEGEFIHRSYAIWPWCPSLSRYRVLRFAQRRWLLPRVTAWLRGVVKHTRKDLFPELRSTIYDKPLQFLMEDIRMTSAIRRCAEKFLERIESGAWCPKAVLQHGDLWTGNILLRQKSDRGIRNPHGFVVIDWGGSSYPGQPVRDVFRYCISARAHPKRISDEIDAHMEILDSDRVDALGYILAGLGSVGLNPGYFPDEVFASACEIDYTRAISLIGLCSLKGLVDIG